MKKLFTIVILCLFYNQTLLGSEILDSSDKHINLALAKGTKKKIALSRDRVYYAKDYCRKYKKNTYAFKVDNNKFDYDRLGFGKFKVRFICAKNKEEAVENMKWAITNLNYDTVYTVSLGGRSPSLNHIDSAFEDKNKPKTVAKKPDPIQQKPEYYNIEGTHFIAVVNGYYSDRKKIMRATSKISIDDAITKVKNYCKDSPRMSMGKPDGCLIWQIIISNRGKKVYDKNVWDEEVAKYEKSKIPKTSIAKKPELKKPEAKKPEKQVSRSVNIDSSLITIGSGSGFYINNKGYALTNNHVIDICKQSIAVIDGKETLFRVIATDKTNDVAVLKTDYKSRNFIKINEDGAKLGENVIAVGYPLAGRLSDSVKITRGIVSSLSGLDNNIGQIQIDAALQPGNSGGPVLNENGELVGIASAGLNKLLMAKEAKYIPENVNFAVASPIVVNILKSKKVKYTTPGMFSGSFSNTELAELGDSSTIQLFCRNTRAEYARLKKSKQYSQVLLDID